MAGAGILEIFAITAPGLEPLALRELADLGIAGSAVPGGVVWSGDQEQLYLANLQLRTASRIVVRMANFRARSFIELERHARRIDWGRYAAPGRGIRLRVSSRKSRLYHERAIAERLTRFVGESIGATVSAEEAEDEGEGEETGTGQLLLVRFHRDECVISVDASGALLHRRGYRQAVARAPLRETLAAALLLASGWNGHTPLVDPFCGSGTIPIEAALIARGIPPGIASPGFSPRRYAFQQWPGFDSSLWNALLDRARDTIRPAASATIRGSDRDAGAIDAARANAERAGVLQDVELEVVPLSAIPDTPPASWLITNPPYGIRVGEAAPLRNLYASIGQLMRARFNEGGIAMVSADPVLERQAGIEWTELLSTRNGGIGVRFVEGRVG